MIDVKFMYLLFCLLVKVLTKVFNVAWVKPIYVNAGCLILCNGFVKKSLILIGLGLNYRDLILDYGVDFIFNWLYYKLIRHNQSRKSI